MDRPLWQIFLTLFALGFAVQRGGVGAVLYLGGAPGLHVAAYALQGLAGLAVALGLWLGRRWVLGAVALLGMAVGASALLEAFALGVRPPLAAVATLLVAAVSTGALLLILHRELDPEVGTAWRGGGSAPPRESG